MPTESISSLVKFCPAETGMQILASRSLRWSAPHLFGDPFELRHESDPGITVQALTQLLLREALIILFGPRAPLGRHNRLVNTLARWRDEERFCDEEEAGTVLRELLGQIAALHVEQLGERLAAWRRFARTIRVACFCERPGNLSGWQRYADRHRGVALRFDCGEGTALPAPRPLRYQSEAPQVTTLAAEVETLFGRRQPLDPGEFIDRLLVGARPNRGEAEWRCFHEETGEVAADAGEWYSLRPFPAAELRAVYLGACMAETQRDEIVRMVRSGFPDTRVYQAAPVPGRYELAFMQVGRG